MIENRKYLEKISKVINKGPFKDNWDSLTMYQLPEWFKEAKFGIFIHWGVYSVPAFSNEWYSRNMYIQGSEEYEHHIKTYGKHTEFGYKDFIPMFKAENFNPEEWAAIFKKSGAKYVIPVAEHHDGFQMYNSSISEFNAYQMGPKRDVLGELKESIESNGMKFCISSHRAAHWFFMSHGKEFESDIHEPLMRGDFYWPSMPEPDHQDLYGSMPNEEYLEDWLIRCCEIVDEYRPKVFYFDWWIQNSAFKPYLKKFAAYYYNKTIKWWGKPGIINYKHDAFMFGSAVVDIERGQFAQVKPYYWQTDTAVARNSWCHTVNNVYKSPVEIICDLVDIVSKNGNLLLNIGPRADGSIPEEDREILFAIGDWLDKNGEAIYGTSYWRVFGEGPTIVKEGHFTDSEIKAFTSQDIRFTVKGKNLYVTSLNYPETNSICIKSLGNNSKHFHGIISNIEVLGYNQEPTWDRNDDELVIKTEGIMTNLPVVFRLIID